MLIQVDQSQHFNPLMQCGILLAGFGLDNARHHLNDGVLTGEEIVSQDLRGTELVTLSVAPRSVTGGPVRHDAVGLLPHLFQQAGAGTVVSGSWSVDEQWKQMLLEAFYRYLADGQSKAQALRAAQQELRDSADRVCAAYWAGWRLTGEGWDANALATSRDND